MGKVYQVNNLVISSGKPIGPEDFLNRMVETLGITVDRSCGAQPQILLIASPLAFCLRVFLFFKIIFKKKKDF